MRVGFAKAKRSASDRGPIQLAISFVTSAPAPAPAPAPEEREQPHVPFAATDDDMPAIFFEEVNASKTGKAASEGSKNLGAAEAVTD